MTNNKKLPAVLAGTLGLAVVGAAAFLLLAHTTTTAAVAQSAPPPAPPVTVSTPLQRQVTDWNELTGQFSAVNSVEIRARVSGYLTEIHFTDGQIVHKGDLLFVIDPRPYEVELQQAVAQYQTASAQLDLANRELSRTAQLRKGDFASAETYDQRVQQQRAAQAAVEQAKAAIRSAQLDLEFSHITAPIDGRISKHLVSVGNLVSGGPNAASTTLLTTIVSLDPIYLDFDMSEADYLAYERAVREGKLGAARDGSVTVQARLMDEQAWHRQGTLNFLDNQLDRGSGTIRARASFPNKDDFIVPGQFARLRLPTSAPHLALLVPDAAVATDQSRKLVMTVSADGTVVPKVIEPGPLFDGLRIVRSGLNPSDKVIINGLMRARPGAKVTPQPGKIEAPQQS